MGSKILVVDDEREIADVVELYLKNENYQVVKCYNGRDALEAAGKREAGPGSSRCDAAGYRRLHNPAEDP